MCQTLKKRRQRTVERLGFSFFGSDKHCFMKNLVGASREKNNDNFCCADDFCTHKNQAELTRIERFISYCSTTI